MTDRPEDLLNENRHLLEMRDIMLTASSIFALDKAEITRLESIIGTQLEQIQRMRLALLWFIDINNYPCTPEAEMSWRARAGLGLDLEVRE